jgi:hypothetical protein
VERLSRLFRGQRFGGVRSSGSGFAGKRKSTPSRKTPKGPRHTVERQLDVLQNRHFPLEQDKALTFMSSDSLEKMSCLREEGIRVEISF